MLLNIPTFAGESINGIYKGTRVQNSQPDQHGQTTQRVFCAIEYEVPGAYGPEIKRKELRISDSLIKAGIPAKLAVFNGQEISLPFWEQEWKNEKNGKSGVIRYLANSVSELFK